MTLAGHDAALALKLAVWRAHPEQFVRDVWPGTVPDPWQDEVLREFGSGKPLLRQSMQGPTGNGKSAVLAWCGLNFLTCYGDERNHPCGAIMAVTRENLQRHLWTEYTRWLRASLLMSSMFDQTSELIFLREHPQTWWLSARGYPKDADENTLGRTLSGLHSPYTLIQVDESGAVPPQIINVGEQAASTAKVFRFQQGGNPLSRKGMLFAVTSQQMRKLWSLYEITADPDDPRRTTRIDPVWAQQQIDARPLGRDDPWVRAYILGRFPAGDVLALLTDDEVRTAMARAPRKPDFDWAAKLLSADVGREGLDPSAKCERQGCMVWPFEERHGLTGRQGAAWLAERANRLGSDMIFMDGTGGHGWSWIEPLQSLGFPVHPVVYSSAPKNKRFGNLRAEMWWDMAESVRTTWALPNDPGLAEELTSVTYYINPKNDRFYIEDKDSVKAGPLGRSPNKADSLAQTVAAPVQPRSGGIRTTMDGPATEHALTEWDAFK